MFKRILSVFGANAFGQIINTLVRLLSVPIFLHCWGKALYGEWILLLTIPSYLAVSGTGVGYVTANDMVMKNSKGLQKESVGIFQSAWVFLLSISVLFVLVAVLIATCFPFAHWLNISHINASDTTTTFILLAIYTVFTLQGEILQAPYRAEGILPKAIFISNLIILAENLALFIVVFASKSVVLAMAVYLAVRVVGTCIMAAIIVRKASWFELGVRHAKLSTIKASLLSTFSCMGINVSNALSVQGLVTIIGIRLGATAVVGFTVVRTIINLIKQISSMIYYSVWPEFSTALATNNITGARKLHRYACQITLMLALVNIVFLLLVGKPIIHIWTNGRLDIDYAFFALMLISLLPNTFWVASSYVQVSINKFEKIAFYCLIFSAAAIVLTFFSIPYFGLTCVPIIQIVVDVIMFSIVVKDSLKLVQDKFSDFIVGLFDFSYLLRFKKLPKVIYGRYFGQPAKKVV